MKKSELRKMIREELINERFPKKAVEFNKVNDPDGFWKWSVDAAMRAAGARFKGANQIGDLILFLNMAASAWERTNK